MSEKMTMETNDPGRESEERQAEPGDGEASETSGDTGEVEVVASEGAAETEPSPAEAPAEGMDERSAERIAELEKQAADLKDRWMRASADLENHRRRSRREIEDARADGTKRTLAEVLPVVDNLERALQHAETATSDEARGIAEGVTLVMRQFAQALERLNVQPVEAEGMPFDPAVHEAMSQVETAELAPGTVAQVLQRGYKLGERLLRPALVVVAKAAPEPEESAGPNGKGPDDGPGDDGDA